MEKYGVEIEDDVKVASEGEQVCPQCGRVLEPTASTGVPFCRTCGTKPFEQPSK